MNTRSKDKIINKETIKEEKTIPLKKVIKTSPQIFKCGHGCYDIFKSKRQKLLHHDKLDYICEEEKSNLMNLITNYNLVLNKLLPTRRQKKKYKDYLQLLKQYQKTKRLSKDPFQFEAIVQLK